MGGDSAIDAELCADYDCCYSICFSKNNGESIHSGISYFTCHQRYLQTEPESHVRWFSYDAYGVGSVFGKRFVFVVVAIVCFVLKPISDHAGGEGFIGQIR